MRIVPVGMVTPAALDWLHRTESASVMHVFPAACNLVNEERQVISLVTEVRALGPFSILLAENSDPGDPDLGLDRWIGDDSPVIIDSGNLIVGGLSLFTNRSRLWDPTLDWRGITDAYLSQSLPLIKKSLLIYGPAESLAGLLFGQTMTTFQKSADLAWTDMGSGLIRGELGLVVTGAERLSGLGAGLTPAGDDFLMGVIYALKCFQIEDLSSMIQTIVSVADSKTTTLSAAWLQAAAEDQAGILWHQLAGAIRSGNEEEVESSSREILAVGHTSGSDALTGFIWTAELFSHMDGRSCDQRLFGPR
jgi:hypothetical protein